MTMVLKTANYKTHRLIDKNSVEAVKVYPESGQTRETILQGISLALLAALLISGCAAAYSPAPLPTNHPANPAAPETPPPPPSQVLRNEGGPLASTEEASIEAPHVRQDMKHGGH